MGRLPHRRWKLNVLGGDEHDKKSRIDCHLPEFREATRYCALIPVLSFS